MKHRIRAAGIAVNDDKVLLIKHVDGDKEYWIPPGGGIEAIDESTMDTVKREVLEESGLEAEVGPLLYVREFFEAAKNTYHIELFYLLKEWRGELNLKNLQGMGGDEHLIVDAKWLSKQQMSDKNVFPKELRDSFWDKLQEPTIRIEYLGRQTEQTRLD